MRLKSIVKIVVTFLLLAMLVAASGTTVAIYSAGGNNQDASLGVSEVSNDFHHDSSSIVGGEGAFDGVDWWSDFVEGDGDSAELIVGLDNERPNSYAELMNLVATYGGKVVDTVSIGAEIAAVLVDVSLEKTRSFAEETEACGLSRYVEPKRRFQTCFVPNDPNWTIQWGPQKIGVEYAWNTTTGDPSVLVAVIDTGIDYNHSDLIDNYNASGYDWVNYDPDPLDDHGHGTHCAGIIAATLNNNIGIAGVGQVQVMAEKALSAQGSGWDFDLAQAIIHAVDQGADILSNSWGSSYDSVTIHDAIKYAYNAEVLVVAAAGNSATSTKHYPAAYDEVVAVAATDEDDNPAQWTGGKGTNFGDWIELAAPGDDIYSTLPMYTVTVNSPPYSKSHNYDYLSGTSMACPHVAGVAALVWSQFPNVSRDYLRLRLQVTADDLGDPGFDIHYGHGRINAAKAIGEAVHEHDLLISGLESLLYVKPTETAYIRATVTNLGVSNEIGVAVQLLANGSIVDSKVIDFLASCESAKVGCSWIPTVEGTYNITFYVVPVLEETHTENNKVWTYVGVAVFLKAVVLDSGGTDMADAVGTWQELNTNWETFGDLMIYIDYMTLNKDDITYEDIVTTQADVLIISWATHETGGFLSFETWTFTDSEIDAITRYVQEGHGLIATGRIFYNYTWGPIEFYLDDGISNNNKLAPLFGLNKTRARNWNMEGTTSGALDILDPDHLLFANVPNPYNFSREINTAIPFDGKWDENELAGGTYVALGPSQESAIVVHRGLVYISPELESLTDQTRLQLLYNAITWSRYQKPEHELITSLECPTCLKPGESVLLNATVFNMGVNNETDVELYLFIDGIPVSAATIPNLLAGSSYTINYLWTPTLEAIYNVTAYALPIIGEDFTANNFETRMVVVMLIIGRVVFGQTHYPAYTIEGGYSEFADCLRTLGCTVSAIYPGEIIDSNLLALVDVLVVVAPQAKYYTSEIDAIETWVKRGGRLLLIGDRMPPSPFWEGKTSTEIIAGRFDINLGDHILDTNDCVEGCPYWPYFDGANLPSHPITNEVTRVETYLSDGIASAPADAIPLIMTDSDGTATWPNGTQAPGVSVMSALDGGTAGSGRLVIITSRYIWDSTDRDVDDDISFYDSGNEILALNAVKWLTGRHEHDVTITLKTLPQSIPPCRLTILEATVYNRGLSNETDVELQLEINGTVKASVAIPELPVDSSYTLRHLWVPTVEGTYNITAYAPQLSGEAFLVNNVVVKVVSVVTVTGTVISLEPPESIMMLDDVFIVNVTVTNVEDLYGWQIALHFDPDVVGFINWWLPPDHVFTNKPFWAGTVARGPYYVVFAATLMGSVPTFNGSGTLCQMRFGCVAPGSGSLRIDLEVAGAETQLFKVVAGEVENIPFTPLNAFVEAFQRPPVLHDVAIVDATLSHTKAYAGWTVDVMVTVKNEGEATETFNVTAYYNNTLIETKTVFNLAPGTNVTLTFSWDTTNVQPHRTYTIWAEATSVPSEIDIVDNALVIGKVRIKLMADINDDGIVDILDMTIAAIAFGSQPGDPNWNPDADLNQDGIINIFDLVIIGTNFGKTA